MNEQLQKEIFQRLDALAAKLGTTASYLWQVLVKQARVEGIIDLTLGGILLAGVVAWCLFLPKLSKWTKKDAEEHKGERDHTNPFAATTVVGSIIAVMVFVWSLACFFDATRELGNPEFWALHQLGNLFK